MLERLSVNATKLSAGDVLLKLLTSGFSTARQPGTCPWSKEHFKLAHRIWSQSTRCVACGSEGLVCWQQPAFPVRCPWLIRYRRDRPRDRATNSLCPCPAACSMYLVCLLLLRIHPVSFGFPFLLCLLVSVFITAHGPRRPGRRCEVSFPSPFHVLLMLQAMDTTVATTASASPLE